MTTLEPTAELDFQRDLVRLARTLGWRTAYFRPAKTNKGWRTPVGGDGEGWLDLCLVRDRVLFIELKAGRNKVTDAQQGWIDALTQAGAEVHVWHADNTPLDDIMAVLLRREHREAAA